MNTTQAAVAFKRPSPTNYTTRLAARISPTRALLSGLATGALLAFSPPAWSQLKQINDPGITTTFARDNLKRLTGKTQNLTDAPASTRNVGYQWVPAGTGGGGELSGITYPSGKLLTYQYDSTGLITGVLWDGQPLISNLKWNPLGQPTSWTWPFTAGQGGTGVSAQRSYNTAGQLIQSETASYTWDAAGRVTQIGQQLFRPLAATNPNGDPTTAPLGVTSTFGYDAAGRLTSVTHTPDTTSMPSPWVTQDIIGPLNTTYSWDANSNRTQADYTNYGGSGLTKSLTRTFTLEAGKNRIASVHDTRQIAPTGTDTQTHSFDWDASGKLMRYHDASIVFTRDPAGRISAAQTAGTGRTTYQTNALAQRVRKQSNIETTDTVYGDDEAFPGTSSYPLGSYRVATQNGQSIQNTEYIYLPTAAGPMPIAVQIGNELLAIHTDHLNTPRRLTDHNGQPAWQWPVSGFGEVEPSTPATGWIRPRLGDAGEIPNTTQISFDLRYPGQQYDKETGLYYNHHRTYDPFLTVGYMEADPLGLNAGWNRFGYVGGNALGTTDPNGLWGQVVAQGGVQILRVCAKFLKEALAALTGAAAGKVIVEVVDCEKDNSCPPSACPPCRTIDGRVISVGTIGYRPLDVIPDNEKQHGVYGSHHNIFIAKQNPNNCRCFWAKQSYVLKPGQLPSGAVPIAPFVN